MKARITQTTNTEDRNSRSGRIGSAARASTRTKIASETSDTTNITMMVGEPQSYSVPPHDSARVSPAAPMETNTMPT